MKILGMDFETQHDDASTTPVTEVGAVLIAWDGLKKPGTGGQVYRPEIVLRDLSELVYHPGYPPQTAEIVELTGITDEMLRAGGKLPTEVMPRLIELVEHADEVWAYNKKFDKTVFESLCARLGLTFPRRPWLCPMSELPWPRRINCLKLGHLAFEMKIPMDHRELHRATGDVNLMFELVMTHFSLDEIQAYTSQPWIYVKADVGKPWIDPVGNAACKKRGFTFEKAKGTDEPVYSKTWVKRIKLAQLEQEKALASFPVVVLTPLQA